MTHPSSAQQMQSAHYDIRLLFDMPSNPHRQDQPVINYRHARQAESILNMIKLPVCKYIIMLLADHPDGLIVNEILLMVRMNISDRKKQSVISNHLTKLRKYGVVSYNRVGKKHIYTLCHSRIGRIARALDTFCHPKTNHDESR